MGSQGPDTHDRKGMARMLEERDYALWGGPHYKPKHPVNTEEGVELVRNLEIKLDAIRQSLEVDMATHNGRREVVGRLRIAGTAVAFMEMWVWNTETKVEKEADAIYQTDLPGYVKRALVDAGYRTLKELYGYKNWGKDKAPGIGRRGNEYIRNWKDVQDYREIYADVGGGK